MCGRQTAKEPNHLAQQSHRNSRVLPPWQLRRKELGECETAAKGEVGEEFGEREQGQAGSWAKLRGAVKSAQGGKSDVYRSFLRAKIPFGPNPLIQVIVLTGL